MISGSVAPSGRRIISRTVLALLTFGASGLEASRSFRGTLETVFFARAFLATGSTAAGAGAGVGVSTWIAFQIRCTAVLRLVNFDTGFS